MSITYDSEKWTNPLRVWDLESQAKRSKAPEVVALSELRYFRVRDDSSDKADSAYVDEGSLEKAPGDPSPESRSNREKLSNRS